MKAYGIKRNYNLDSRHDGYNQTSVWGKSPTKSKQKTRQLQKGKARAESKKDIDKDD